MAVPVLTAEQRAKALERAAEVRAARAELKNRLAKGEMTLADAFAQADTDDVVGKMKVKALLGALPNVGAVTVQKWMAEAEIDETRRVRGLGSNQRRVLLSAAGR